MVSSIVFNRPAADAESAPQMPQMPQMPHIRTPLWRLVA
jgi:hypothetical protein